MPHYFLHLRDGTSEVLDRNGQDFDTIVALQEHMRRAARDIMAEGVHEGRLDLRYRLEAENDDGEVLERLEFRDALTILDQHDAAA